MSKMKELKDLSNDELEARYSDEQKNLFTLVNDRQQSRQQFEKPHRIRAAKREIARILTLKREKQLAKLAKKKG